MKKSFVFVLLLIPFLNFAQLTENFSDGDFTSNPTWVGDGGNFIVNASQQLQLNAAAAGTSYLAIPAAVATLDNTEWQCYVRLNFDPSSSNYGRVYLASDQSNLTGPLNGYYLQFGESLSNDAIELFKQTGTTVTSVARGTNGFVANSFAIRIKVRRDNSGQWSIYADPTAGTTFLLQATGTDATYNSSSFSGVVCTYTSSNITAYYFDDFYLGPFILDLIPPTVSSINVINQNTIDVVFDEGVEQNSAETISNYTVGGNNPSFATRTSINTVRLTFATNFISGVTNTLSVLNVKDLSDNAITTASTGQFTYYTVSAAALSDIIINEVLYDPVIDDAEFIELYNRSQKVIDLSSLRLSEVSLTDDSLVTPIAITSTPYLLLPGKYVVLTKDPDGVKSSYNTPNPDAFILVSAFPSLNNTGDAIAITNSSSTIRIDQFNYSPNLQFTLLNDEKGVSLERISFNRPTQDSTNWHSAAETVGFATPAYENSQHTETIDDGSEVSVEPEIFSPDNDQLNDIVNIHYHFDAPGYTANLKIFDSKGRLMIHLIKNSLLGTAEGTFAWDGITNENEKAKVGIYVAYLEVFKADGTVKKFKKPLVLAARL